MKWTRYGSLAAEFMVLDRTVLGCPLAPAHKEIACPSPPS